MLVIGTGPTELHAHIDLDHRVGRLATIEKRDLRVLAAAECDGHWSVVASVHPETAGEQA